MSRRGNASEIAYQEEVSLEKPTDETIQDTESVNTDIPDSTESVPIDTTIEIVDDDEMESPEDDTSGDTPEPTETPEEEPVSKEPEPIEIIDDESETIDSFADDMEKPAEPVPNNDMYFNGENPYQTAQSSSPMPVEPMQTKPMMQEIPAEPTTVGIDVMMSKFGTDDSPQQNQYNPKEVERLNELIASENSAIGEYFQASKETNVDVLRRLYSDIGEEERFHVEQLLFAKSQITGEKYVPRDPDIKKEYEELLSMGMDEESAMATAVDKVGLMNKSFTISPDEAIHEMEILTDQVSMIQEYLYQDYLITQLAKAAKIPAIKARNDAVGLYIEAYANDDFETPASFIMEDGTQNTSTLNTGILSTISRIIKRLIGIVVSFVKNTGRFAAAKVRWLRNHKLSELFKEGVSLYFYNIGKNGNAGFAYSEAVIFLLRLYKCATMIASEAGIRVETPKQFNFTQHVEDDFNPKDVRQAIEGIRHINMMKTKVIIDDTNKNLFLEEVFGVGGNSGKPGSVSVFVNLTNLLKDFSNFVDFMNKLANDFKNLQNVQGSLYQTKPGVYKELEKYLDLLIKRSQAFSNYITHDTGVLQKMEQTLDSAAESEVQSGDTAQTNGTETPENQDADYNNGKTQAQLELQNMWNEFNRNGNLQNMINNAKDLAQVEALERKLQNMATLIQNQLDEDASSNAQGV